ncbi:MAG: AAA family ATPase [Syntrophales bacterium]
MILERLVLENFRQFKGRQEIVFSDLRDRNVTVVHAENGFGKTTLLKALLWGLYGRDGLMGNDGNPDDFEHPDSIIHEGLALRAKDPLALAAAVEITFKHNTDRYILRRQLTLAQQKLNPRQTTLSLEVMRDGQTFPEVRPQQRIQAIVPDGISRFLFFNGERINYLAMERNSGQVTEAIHQMLGLELLKQTIDDLRHQNVRGKLRNELKEMTSDEKRELIEQLSKQEEKSKEFSKQHDQIIANLKAIQTEIASVDNKLAANRVAHELQTKRIHLTLERDELSGKREEVTKRLSKLIADDGYTLFTSPLINRGREIVAQLRSEGKIPARVLNTFLQELLEHSKCICTRNLVEGSPERAAVENLLTIAGDQDFNNAVGALDHAIGLIEGVSGQTQDLLNQLKMERLEYTREIREREEEIEEIHQKLGGKNDEEVSQLEEKRKSLSLDRDAQNAAIGRIGEQIKVTTESIETLETQIRQIEDKVESAARSQRRVDAVEDCANILDQILKAETEELRPLLNTEIDCHFRKIMTKDYWAELTDNYTLRIRKRVAGGDGSSDSVEIDAALSTGERTVTSLVFIASLVALAKKRSEIPTILKDLAGSAFPIAIDSPFGSLSIFREGVAKYLPELAPQVVLFVSPKQYDGEVEAALKASGRISKRYYLRYYGPSMPERAAPELVVDGQSIQQYCPLESDEYTEIVPL